MTRIHTLLVSAAATCLCMTAVGADQLYKWVDDQGHTHYSQTPPPSAGTKAKAVNIEVARADATAAAAAAAAAQNQPPKTESAPPGTTSDIEREAAIREKVDADEQAGRDKAAHEQTCSNLRSHLQSMQHADDGLSQHDKGSRKLTDDVARQKQIDALQATINQSC